MGWSAIEYAFLGSLGALLLGSAFFSGSETALFGMSEAERGQLRRRASVAARAVEQLVRDPRMLLITILLGNMTVNVLYFVISSVLMMRSPGGAAGQLALALLFLLVIVLVGEVLPKIAANSRRTTFARLTAPPLLTLHRGIAPLRMLIDRLVVSPLSRLTAPAAPPPDLHERELHALIELSRREGVIDAEERRLLQDVIDLGRMKVREVMTPRVRMHAVARDATRAEVIDTARTTRFTRLPVHAGGLDRIVGILHVKRYFLGGGDDAAAMTRATTTPRFVPQMATLEQLLDHFRHTHTQSAIVVDEFGGTAGIVALEDVVEAVVGGMVQVGDDVPAGGTEPA